MSDLVCSEAMWRYFDELIQGTEACYSIARKARARGLDPETYVEIPKAEDLASRVEKLLEDWKVDGVAERIRELSKEYNREEVSLLVAKEVAQDDRGGKLNKEECIDRAIRVGLAVLTEGILVAPLEGIAKVRIMSNRDGSQYIDIQFAGPIRAAGGTGQAMSVLIGDVVRREQGIGRYIPERGEVERFKEEIPLYKRQQHLQYSPSNDEIDLIVSNCPVCIDGEGTEKVEISGFRDLPRIETNRVRGGACLVIAEGLCQKAPKILKHVANLKLEGWDFMEEFVRGKAGTNDNGGKDDPANGVKPSYKYLKDIVAGRPIFSHPSRIGGFRLRYGRGRTTGLAAIAISPASMHALQDFLAIGTQIKIERPGKAGAVTPCDALDGPFLLLDDGSLVQCQTSEEVMAVRDRVDTIIDLGEILIPFGEFAENNHVLVPPSYTLEWHLQELRARTQSLPEDWRSPSFERALVMSKELDVPLHPAHNLFWSDVSIDSLQHLREAVIDTGRIESTARFRPDAQAKRTLEDIGALHTMVEGEASLFPWESFIAGLGLGVNGDSVVELRPLDGDDSLAAVSDCMGVKVMPRAQTRIGTRMARPEKAKERKMNPPVHLLFPIGLNGGPQRLLKAAAAKESGNGGTELEIGVRRCPVCERLVVGCMCDCGSHTKPFDKPTKQGVRITEHIAKAAERLGVVNVPEIKAVQGMMSRTKTPEAIEKGILRAMNEVFVYKDGTCRFDMTDVPVTHFRPVEIGLSVEGAKRLGYFHDMHGAPMERDDQLVELKVQDFIPSESCGTYLVKVANFIDQLLELHYGLEPFYRATEKEDMIGHMAIGLAPHTSGGVLCRIIGYTKANSGYAHPFFHAAKRRNCDGDEDCIMLLMDGLLNFSRTFLPDRRGGLMDAPLVLTLRLAPDEVDKEAQNMDVLHEYPLELYRAACEYRHPKEIKRIMDMVESRIGTEAQYEGLGFTIDTRDIAEGPKDSTYKVLDTMLDKMNAQLDLARQIRAVDASDVVTRVVSKHFMPDMIGNLNSFNRQQFRCTKCGSKYRRIPLSGKCYCGNKLTLTVHEASVKKYLDITKEICEEYDVNEYTCQRISIIERSINSLFENDKVKKCKLSDFF